MLGVSSVRSYVLDSSVWTGNVKSWYEEGNNALVGYYTCTTSGGTANKVVNDASGYVLSLGGSMKIKFTNKHTGNNTPTLNINNQGEKTIVYDGSVCSSTNTWEAGETVEAYFDGSVYQLNNVAGGGTFKTGEKVKNVGIGDVPTIGSKYLIRSGGVESKTSEALSLQNAIESLAGNNINHSNLCNPFSFSYGRISSTGYVDGTGTNYKTTGFIEVESGVTYNIITVLQRSLQYDADKNIIENSYRNHYNEEGDSGKTLTILPNAKYVRVSFSVASNPDGLYFGLGDSFVKYNELSFGNDVIPLSAVRNDSFGNPEEDSEKIVKSKDIYSFVRENGVVYEDVVEQSANLHNSLPAASATDEQPTDGRDWLGHSLTNAGLPNVSADYTVSYFIKVESGQSYKASHSIRRYNWYNENKTSIGRVTDSTPAGTELVAPDGALYIRFVYLTSIVSSPSEFKFGKYADDINVDYYYNIKRLVEDKYGREIALVEDVEEYIEDVEEYIDNKDRINVLLIGSSLGVNTIIQVPYLINSCGIKTTVGNMYFGSATLEQWADRFTNNTSVSSCAIYTSEAGNWVQSAKTPQAMLDAAKWDVIILQRGAAEANTWTDTMSNALGVIIDNIKSRVDYAPKIMFNCTPARSVEYFSHGNRQNQINYTKNIMITAKKMQEEYGLEIISSAIAIQNARNTLLAQYGTYGGDSSGIPDLSTDRTHLDIGVGSYVLGAAMVEQILSSYNKSMIANSFFPTASQLATRGVWTAVNYTDPSNITNYFRIANACAFSSVLEPWKLNKILPTKYPMPGATPSDWDLDIDYSSIYNEGDTDQTPDVDPA